MHSDNTLLANARAVAADWRLGADSVVYSLSPLSHNLGIGALVTAMAVGGELVVHDLPKGRSLLDRLVETGATYLVGVPTHAIDLLAELRARGGCRELRVKGFRISGAPVAGEVIAELMEYGIVPQSGYGMTETCSHQYTLPDDDPRLIMETAGRCCPGFEIKIWREDDPDIETGPGEVGQIGSRGASLMLGYFDDQIATEEAFNSHGWFMTGDLGQVDANGYLRIRGRLKDVIIRGGKKIYPAPIEALALRHPAIERAAAFPVADTRLGEKVCLAVVFRGGMASDGDAILEHLNAEGLSRFDMPEYLLPLDHTEADPDRQGGKTRPGRRGSRGTLSPRPGAPARRPVMRAALVRQFGGIDAVCLATLPDPVPGPDELLIAIHAAPVNYADLLVIAGRYQTRPQLPFIPGKSAAGVVTAVGGAVTRFHVGDRVLAWVEEGGYAESLAAPEGVCHRLPAAMPFVDAAALGLDYATAWFALRDRARFRPGE